MLVKAALKGHGSAAHGVLEAFDGTGMALAGSGLGRQLAVVLNQGLQLVTAGIQGAREIERDIGRMVIVGLAELVGPIIKQLPFVGSLFRNLNCVSVHIYSASL